MSQRMFNMCALVKKNLKYLIKTNKKFKYQIDKINLKYGIEKKI